MVVSIPDPPLRQSLLDELIGLSDVMEDCSGYSSSTDDEDD